MYDGTLFPQKGTVLNDAVIAEFAVNVLRDPNNRAQHATRIFAGDWAKASELLRFAETAEFTAILTQTRSTMTKMEQTYTKTDFIISVQDKMSQFDGELWLKTAQFYAKLQGFITDAPTVAIQNNNVIQVPQQMAANDWEKQAMQHQNGLQTEARVIND